MVLIGSHVSMSGKKMLLGAAEEAASYNADTFMIYTGAPQNTRRKAIEEMNIPAGEAFMKEHKLSNIVVHAPYIINLGNTIKPENFGFATQFLREEIVRSEALGAKQITMHPGAHVGAGADAAIAQIVKGLNEVLTKDQTAQIALETMAGKGTEIGRTFEELAKIIEGVTLNEKLSVTLDTCHINDAGYNVREDFDGVLEEFDRIIGLDRLKVIHVNDSKNPQGSHKDRHANIGFGTIGFEALNKVVHHPKLSDLAKILETPYVGEDKKDKKAPYGYEIKMFREQKFNPNLIEDILNQVGFE
ncbi:MAG: deoxyribonuclease IV [Carnobacterium sp.]|jgi:deoxyribonuclease-4|uniref:Probable endonuclease 4 n=2 Tax=Carnobacterium maltaromaticum TaxID=2751 RepID=K8E455_CARML|nr:deoxyribonuclease IV [Carnobacterium maltaromaticum]AOA02142.1 deoxyribonuclease IV [Carnobacterium maltaromaticum]KRN65797.1 endonuclease 4 [Carnobacterium maltaromaticum DSM 20342]KRN72318.1 endonuclease 4 [Carnobacterium maltaromaticum]KRN87900.1 endonuclease 4 [Carnobacterium maltaromaticum]MBC9789490.1 deoxyribonuclease IV [Carnobacterium maltaromaticum]